jgi:hypothetical protein
LSKNSDIKSWSDKSLIEAVFEAVQVFFGRQSQGCGHAAGIKDQFFCILVVKGGSRLEM